MAKSGGIFQKRRLTPGQFRAVAALRFDDAAMLLNSGQNARANGAMYLGGFVIECLLKALLLERHPNLAVPVDPARLSGPDHEVLGLLYSHDLDDMVGFLPEVKSKLDNRGRSRCAVVALVSGRMRGVVDLRPLLQQTGVHRRGTTVSSNNRRGERMSEATVKAVPGFVGRLADALRQDMPGATVDTEHIRGNRYRFLVEWDQFTGVGHPDRQRRVWAVAEKVVPRADMLDVGMILTIAPDEHY